MWSKPGMMPPASLRLAVRHKTRRATASYKWRVLHSRSPTRTGSADRFTFESIHESPQRSCPNGAAKLSGNGATINWQVDVSGKLVRRSKSTHWDHLPEAFAR